MGSKIVLLSGGWESLYCLSKAGPCTALFINYGQPYADREFVAALEIGKIYNVPVMVHRVDDIPCKNGIFKNRNQTLIAEAEYYYTIDELWFGCRGLWALFDRYGDSNRAFADVMEATYGIKIRTPCLMLPKWYIKWKLRKDPAAKHVFSSEGLS